MRRLLIGVLVLVVLLLAADRVGDYVAETAAADTLQNSQHLSSTPDVNIAGFPFLTQLAARDFDDITIDASGVPIGGRLLRISHFRVVLHGVTVSTNFHSVRARTADATARASYADLSKTLHVPVTYAGNGRVRAEASISIAGRSIGGSVTARPELHDASLGFGALNADGQVGRLAARELGKVFDVAIPLAQLPFQVQVRDLEATPSGLVLQLHGSDLSYSR